MTFALIPGPAHVSLWIIASSCQRRADPGTSGRGRLVLLMIGAAIAHTRRGEVKTMPVNLLLLVLVAVVAWRRFCP